MQSNTAEKYYQLTNQPKAFGIGNLLTTVSDRKLEVSDGSGGIAYYTADIISSSDYYPFGFQMDGRNYSSDSYRYGFNGMEKDDEFTNSTSHYDFGARIYDSRVGRFFVVDPKINKFPTYSSYLFAENNPILKIDINGESEVEVTTRRKVEHKFENVSFTNNGNTETNDIRGKDIITETVIKTINYRDSQTNAITATMTTIQTVTVIVDEEGNVSTPIVEGRYYYSNYTSPMTSGDLPTTNLTLDETSISLQNEVAETEKFKLDNNNLSPLQQEAIDNEEYNDKMKISAWATTGASLITAGVTLTSVPEPVTKVAAVASFALGGVSMGFATAASREEDATKINKEVSSTTDKKSYDKEDYKPNYKYEAE